MSPYDRDQAVQLGCIVRRPEDVAIGANHDGGATVLRHPRGEVAVGLSQILNIGSGNALRLARLVWWPDNDPFPAEAAPQFTRFRRTNAPFTVLGTVTSQALTAARR